MSCSRNCSATSRRPPGGQGRLQLIIAHERDGGGSSANFLPDLQRELIAVISKYVKVNPTTSGSRSKNKAITKCWKSILSCPKKLEAG
jgi:cell division topological specificity factor MinE